MYSKTRATNRTMKKSVIGGRESGTNAARSGVFQRDVKDDVSGIAAAIHPALDQLVKVLDENQHARIGVPMVNAAQQLIHQLVGVAFDRLQAFVVVSNRLPVALRTN